MSSKSNQYSFGAEIRFLSSTEGGRLRPPQSGFKPQLKVGELRTSCLVSSVDPTVRTFSFERSHRVKLQLLFKKEIEGLAGCSLADYCAEGMAIELYEGSKKIAEGYVVEAVQ
jgi:hypothetical protein